MSAQQKRPGRPADTEGRARIRAVLADPEWTHAGHAAVAEHARAGEYLVRAVRREDGYQRPPGTLVRRVSKRPRLPLTPARVALLDDVLASAMRVPSIRALLTTREGMSLRAKVAKERAAVSAGGES